MECLIQGDDFSREKLYCPLLKPLKNFLLVVLISAFPLVNIQCQNRWPLKSRAIKLGSCSSFPNPKSRMVRYPNRETMGNNDQQRSVIVFWDGYLPHV